MMSTDGYDFDANERYRTANISFIDGIGAGSIALDDKFEFPGKKEFTILTPSGENAFKIIRGITCNTNEVITSANLPNNGYINNLPGDAIVEVPIVVSGNGINGLGMGELPRGIAALCQAQINVQHLAVDAGATGNRDYVLQALLVDPNVPSAEAALRIYDELMAIDQAYLPQFKFKGK
jgi:alpha-galactosidase